ncbi:hypothetical protein OG21DRAFT_1489945 [Imleria badia]|nr:hypothetical protein OG21DRAFT_1489945 [Imleria badia]
MGVVYNPFLDYCYTAIRGQGSYLTRVSGQPMKFPLAVPKPLPSLSQTIIAVEWGSDLATPVIQSNAMRIYVWQHVLLLWSVDGWHTPTFAWWSRAPTFAGQHCV